MNYYFIGIGGIGMSAIARFCKIKGHEVSGYDRTKSELTQKLETEGIAIHYAEDIKYIPKDKDNTIVVYTPAIPKDMAELVYAQNNGYKLVKRSAMLGELTANEDCLAVAGTHGKTTTSTMIAHILTDSNQSCSAFLGGISKNYETNMLISQNNTVVVEADEYDRSFLQLKPLISVITSMDADHLDIYGDINTLHETFYQYASQVTSTIIYKYGLSLDSNKISARRYTYHISNPQADYYSKNLILDSEGFYHYDLVYPGGVISDIKMGVIGMINVENSIAAAAACISYGLAPEAIRIAIGSFRGVKRRLDIQYSAKGRVYIDDYAHHPEELRAAINSVKAAFPKRKITGIFQPHLYTRTRDFAPEFADALSLLDELILLDIYPAREQPIEGISSDIIFKDVKCERKVLLNKSELMQYLEKEKDVEVLLTLGAGDIDRFIKPITQLLENE